LIALLLGIAFQFFPNYWQLIVVAGLAAGLVSKTWLKAFAAGFVGVLLSWIVYIAYAWAVSPASEMISILGDIVGIPGLLLVALAVLVASIFGGLGSVITVALRRLLARR
jgi:hypothetical protein